MNPRRREPPDPDPDFDWSDAPPQPRRRRGAPRTENDAYNTGERDSYKPVPEPDPPQTDPSQPQPPATGERELDTDGNPYTTEERSAGRRGRARRGRAAGTDEYERAAGMARRGRSPRRRPPAKVRRRRFFAIAAASAAVLVGGYALLAGGDDGGGGGGQAGSDLPKLIGQTLVGKMGPGGPTKQMLKQVTAGRLGNLIVLPHDAGSLKRDVAKVQKAAQAGGNPPLLVMIGQEGGFVKRLPGPPDTAPNDLGESGDVNLATTEGQSTGSFLAGLGVNVNLAPVLNITVPKTADTIATRSYGSEAETVAELGVAFIQGQQGAGVAATAKHFPGLGLSSVDTDFGASTVDVSEAQQEAAVFPFKAAIDAGVELVMVSTAVYPNLDAQAPAALSNSIVTGQLRGELAFKGPIITDDLEARSITDTSSPEEAAVDAIRAGNDLLLFAHNLNGAGKAFQAMMKAAKAGKLDQAALQTAHDRVVNLKRSLAAPQTAPAAAPE